MFPQQGGTYANSLQQASKLFLHKQPVTLWSLVLPNQTFFITARDYSVLENRNFRIEAISKNWQLATTTPIGKFRTFSLTTKMLSELNTWCSKLS